MMMPVGLVILRHATVSVYVCSVTTEMYCSAYRVRTN